MTPANDPKKMDAARETLAPTLALYLVALDQWRETHKHVEQYDERIAALTGISDRDRALLSTAPGVVRGVALLEAMGCEDYSSAIALALKLVDAADTLLRGLEKQQELDSAKTFRPGLRAVGR